MKKLILPIAAIALILTQGCGSDEPVQEPVEDLTQDTTEVSEDTHVEEFYQIPAPDEMFAFIKQSGLPYSSAVLNSVDNASNYTEPRSQALNFGIYSADLAYTAAFEEYQESIKYFACIRKLGDEVGVSSAFNEGMAKRIQNNLDVADSLVAITNDSYFGVIEYMEENERGKDLALLAAGGWLESVYIVTNTVKEFNKEEPYASRLADQKLIYDNLLSYMDQYKDDQQVATTINEFKEIGTVFENLEEIEVKSEAASEGRMVLGAGKTTTKLVMGEEQFNKLKEIVTNLRNSYTGQSS